MAKSQMNVFKYFESVDFLRFHNRIRNVHDFTVSLYTHLIRNNTMQGLIVTPSNRNVNYCRSNEVMEITITAL